MRKAGLLMPVASLPSDYGIGDFGEGSLRFIDYLHDCGIKVWQILPLNPLGYGNSPYQPYSSFAGDEIYIDLKALYKEGLLKEKPRAFQEKEKAIDYEAVRSFKEAYLKKAFEAFEPDEEYKAFAKQDWVFDYGVFLTLKKRNHLICWNEWPEEEKNWIKDHKFDITGLDENIRYEMFLQYVFYKQWLLVKEYANGKGIEIMGDIPFYVGIDSLDVWKNQEEFLLDKDGRPIFIAGVPPDYFSADGQRWGNPIYNWKVMEKNGFTFWTERFGYSQKLFDIVRIDHFRAFDTYWKIPATCPTAVEGEWILAPGYAFFDKLLSVYPNASIVAEDLGDMRPEVYELRDHYKFPGMKIIQFTFDPLEHNNSFQDRENMIVYTGTHDNETIGGWYENQTEEARRAALIELYSRGYDNGSIVKDFIQYTLDNLADFAILPVQDILELGNEGRMNTPGTLGSPNWEWRLTGWEPLMKAGEFLKEAIIKSGRIEGGRAPMAERDTGRLLEKIIEQRFHKELSACTDKEAFCALMELVKYLAGDKKSNEGKKKVYYISAEFLIGKLLSNNLINLGIYDEVKEILLKNGKTIEEMEEQEQEPSLGNGGLGRLAACFLDSMASLSLNGDGIGLNYHMGLFKQEFENQKQKEVPNPWIEKESWLKEQEKSYTVSFKDFSVKSKLYDIDVTGYDSRTNQLHLFDIDTVDESIIKNGIDFDKEDIAKNLTLFLYPDDSDKAGQLLRIYQQYFMVSNGAQYILEECKAKGCTLHDLDEYAVIQINDTHPSMVIPELIRLLEKEGMERDEAVAVVSKTCAYTNHTILAEALEKWPLDYLEKVVPQLLPIIRDLDARAKKAYPGTKTEIIDKDNRVHMAHMDIHYGFSVNGVAALHTEILKNSELKAFYDIYPEKFNNKTNGITFRRWLMHCNPKLSSYITSLIGEDWKKDADKLEGLLAFAEDDRVLDELLRIKGENKKALSEYILQKEGIKVDENSIFDIQIKRLHEYKRQQMNVLYAIYKYKQIKAGNLPKTPITMIFGAKAAPAYILAKDIIHLILCMQKLIDNDPSVSPWLKLVMVENYNVTKASMLIPACDISEQISLASKEASGTGNMKFMLNGAITLGTMDGANVEIHDLVKDENIYIFGRSSEEVIDLYERSAYSSRAIYDGDAQVEQLVDFIISKELIQIGDPENLCRLYKDLISKDWFMTLLDLKDYIRVKEQAFADYEDRRAWSKKMLVNIGKAGFFSSDRTIKQYNEDIWHLGN